MFTRQGFETEIRRLGAISLIDIHHRGD